MQGARLNNEVRQKPLEPMTGCGLMGALKCVAGMPGVLPMIHGPVSCSSGHRLAMLYAGVEPLLPTTCVEQSQVVLGCADRLADAMNKAFEKYHPEMLVVLLSCATAMTGENYDAVAEAYCRRTKKKALVLDGSALAGDEVDICPKVYKALYGALHLTEGEGKTIALDGLAKTDYGFETQLPLLKRLVTDSLNLQWTNGLFAGSDVFSENSVYQQARKLPVSLLWNREGLDSAAPIGVRGSQRFLTWLSVQTGAAWTDEAAREKARWEAELAPAAEKLRSLAYPVAIEGAGWYAYALADYLKNDLGCRVLLSVDRAAGSIPWESVCDVFFEDMGRFELVEQMETFGARLVFGSSNVQMDDAWGYLPFYQPVWRVVEPVPLLGYQAAAALAQRLLKEAQA